jgi:hypothetical protein
VLVQSFLNETLAWRNMYHVHAHGNHDAQRSAKRGVQVQGRALKTLRTKQDWDQRVVTVGPRKVCSGAAILIDGTMGARRKEERGGVYLHVRVHVRVCVGGVGNTTCTG